MECGTLRLQKTRNQAHNLHIMCRSRQYCYACLCEEAVLMVNYVPCNGRAPQVCVCWAWQGVFPVELQNPAPLSLRLPGDRNSGLANQGLVLLLANNTIILNPCTVYVPCMQQVHYPGTRERSATGYTVRALHSVQYSTTTISNKCGLELCATSCTAFLASGNCNLCALCSHGHSV